MITEAKKLLAQGGSPRLESPYEFMNQNSVNMSAVGPPWSEMTAYDLNTGEIKWRIPTGTVLGPPDLGIPSNSGSHFPRSGPLVTAGGLVFFSTGSDRRFRAYDRDNGREVWSTELPTASEGMPATYAVNGRQFIVVPVAAGAGMFAARFGGPVDSPGGGRGGASALPGQYIALALKQ
jgi:quinoprotein glucose dehydrogenase